MLLSGRIGAGVFSILDRAGGHRLTIDTNGRVSITTGGLVVNNGPVNIEAGDFSLSGIAAVGHEVYSRPNTVYQVAIGTAAGVNQAGDRVGHLIRSDEGPGRSLARRAAVSAGLCERRKREGRGRIDPLAVLALLGDLYNQVAILTQENERLREQLAAATAVKAPEQPEVASEKG